jgi:DNA end-binding protein Ku
MASIPVCKYSSGESANGVSFNQLHRTCGTRLKQQMICPKCDGKAVDRADIVKGYNRGSDKEPDYIVLEQDEINAVAVESSHAIIVEQFVEATEITPVIIDKTDYLAPDGQLACYDFAVVREAMQGKVGIAKLAERGHENLIAIQPFGPGLLVCTLRLENEVRPMSQIDELTRPVAIKPEDVQLAKALLIDSHIKGQLNLGQFSDRYLDALRQVIDAKAKGQPLPIAPKPQAAQPTSMMDMLRKTLAQAGATATAAPTATVTPIAAPPTTKPHNKKAAMVMAKAVLPDKVAMAATKRKKAR